MTFSTASIIKRYMGDNVRKKILEDALQRKLHAVTGKMVKERVEGRSKMSILLGWWVAQELIDD